MIPLSPILDGICMATKNKMANAKQIKRNKRSLRRKASIKKIKGSYTNSLTVHGLSRILTGSRMEKVLWLIALLCVLCIAAYMCNVYFSTYLKHEVQTNRRTDRLIEMPLPAIMICQYIRCYNSKQIVLREYWNGTNWNSRFSLSSNPCAPMDMLREKQNLSRIHVNDQCSLVNPKGDLTQKHIDIPVSFKLISRKSGAYISIGDPKTLAALTAPFIDIFHLVDNACIGIRFLLKQTAYKRVPESNCSNGEGTVNYFSDIYSRKACIQSCYLTNMLNNCGAVIDTWEKYTKLVNTSFRDHNKANNSTRMVSCILKVLDQMNRNQVPKNCHCPIACNEVKFEVEFPYRVSGPSNCFASEHCPDDLKREKRDCIYPLGVTLQYQTNKFEYIEESLAYPLSTLAADIGSIVGSLAGISVLSIAELIMVLVVAVAGLLV